MARRPKVWGNKAFGAAKVSHSRRPGIYQIVFILGKLNYKQSNREKQKQTIK